MKKNIYAVIGQPIWHSLSPLIYNKLFEIYNINSYYLPIELNKNSYKNFLLNFSESINLLGLNVTMPLKEQVTDLLENLDETSKFLGSVNTINLTTKTGYTTDGKGFLLSLKNNKFSLNDKNVVLIGAGGAAKSIAYELQKENIKSLCIINRTIKKASSLAKSLNNPVVFCESFDNLKEQCVECDLLINATNLGMGQLDFENLDFICALKNDCLVYDIIYHPPLTRLLKAAQERNLKIQNGLDMLIYQAFYAFEIFTGIMPNNNDRQKIIAEIKKAQ